MFYLERCFVRRDDALNIGFIGTGNMGKILIEAIIESHSLAPSAIFMTNRTIAKAAAINKIYPETNVMDNASEVIKHSDIIFICVKPLDIHPLLLNVRHLLRRDKCLISITSPVQVEQLESIVNCQVARVIPSITNRAFAGVSLFTFGNSCSNEMQQKIEKLFEGISTPVEIENEITRVASDIVSCGPAFFSYLLQRFVNGAVKETEISQEKAVQLASEMIIGMGKLLETELYTLPTLQEKVCVKGGVTGKGIKVLEEELGPVFENLIKSTHRKYDEDIEEVRRQFEK